MLHSDKNSRLSLFIQLLSSTLMIPLPTLKTELKVWEAKFRAENKRDATKADIKAVPEIGLLFTFFIFVLNLQIVSVTDSFLV